MGVAAGFAGIAKYLLDFRECVFTTDYLRTIIFLDCELTVYISGNIVRVGVAAVRIHTVISMATLIVAYLVLPILS